VRRWAWHRLEGRQNPGWEARVERLRAIGSDAKAFAAASAAALAEHLAFARERFPWWRERIAPGARLADLPPLTRADLQTALDRLVDPSRATAELKADASGGSTGAPVRVVHDASYWTEVFATEVWLRERWGVKPWDKTAYLWGDDRARQRLKENLVDLALGRLKLNAFAMDEARMQAFADRLTSFEAVVIQGYVSALDLFAGFLLAQGRTLPAPRVLRSAAETLGSAQRERIERAFGAPVRDVYGSRESAALAAQCLHGGFHVFAHSRVLEIVDDRGAPQPPGVAGRVLVTDLANRAMGLIRYENGDVAAWDPDPAPCRCGCPFPRLQRVLGRTSDFFTLPSGERVHGEWFTHLFYGRDDVTSFQVRQESLHSIVVLTVGAADAAALAPLLSRARERVGRDVDVSWRRVDAIPPSPSGKHRFTLSIVPWGGASR
jgi:phenylacetate-CoA ligase